MKFWTALKGLAIGAAVSLLPLSASAEGYPDRPITLVVPYGPGGAADLSARMIAGAAPTYLGQPILAVNRTGGRRRDRIELCREFCG